MRPILAGLETEYGLDIEGRGAENQIEESKALVRAFSGKRFSGWDYRFESPRSDLRGFRIEKLAVDPEDAHFDAGKTFGPDQETRADQVLANGARLYNDHGHPEYATPECLSLAELVLHDLAGEQIVASAAATHAEAIGREVRIYKNNTDFHGASYGAHESYLVPREWGFEALYRAVVPILIARQVLCGAGKVGAESGEKSAFQMSQRADFLVDAASAETLYRRPVFNTRDEPHADPARWIRLHVIAGDANMIPAATRRKVGLVKLALALMTDGEVPDWPIPHPAEAFSAVSRAIEGDAEIRLDRRSWTTAPEILESYFAAAERTLNLHPGGEPEGIRGDLGRIIAESRDLLTARRECPEKFRSRVDWAAKRWLVEQAAEANGWSLDHPNLRSYDLEYHRIPRSEGLYGALVEAGELETDPGADAIQARGEAVFEPTRARARAIAVRRFGESLVQASWRALSFRVDGAVETVELRPDAEYPESLGDAADVEEFIRHLRNLP